MLGSSSSLSQAAWHLLHSLYLKGGVQGFRPIFKFELDIANELKTAKLIEIDQETGQPEAKLTEVGVMNAINTLDPSRVSRDGYLVR